MRFSTEEVLKANLNGKYAHRQNMFSMTQFQSVPSFKALNVHLEGIDKLELKKRNCERKLKLIVR